jgi:outer membrane protease
MIGKPKPMGLSHGLAATIAIIAVTTISPAAAADLELHPVYGRHFEVTSLPTWQAEIGLRYFASSGRTKYDLFIPDGSSMISRLTYNNLLAHSGELFGRFDHITGVFIKGYVGGGVVTGGTLTDEDFPPFIVPFSSTNSTQHSGNLAYGTIDFGYAMLNSPTLRLGAFVGYHHYYDQLNAYGCMQMATNPACLVNPPPIPDSTLGITQTTNWDAVRLGLNAQWGITDRLMLTGDLAWLPVAWLNANDHHWQRTDLVSATPQPGGGVNNVQLELVLSYYVTPAFSLGIGGRYWNITTGSQGATMDFTVDGFSRQPLSFQTERWGGFLQAAYKFGG